MHSPITAKAIADSGCSDHYASINADVENIQSARPDALIITLPNGMNIISTHIAILKIQNFLQRHILIIYSNT